MRISTDMSKRWWARVRIRMIRCLKRRELWCGQSPRSCPASRQSFRRGWGLLPTMMTIDTPCLLGTKPSWISSEKSKRCPEVLAPLCQLEYGNSGRREAPQKTAQAWINDALCESAELASASFVFRRARSGIECDPQLPKGFGQVGTRSVVGVRQVTANDVNYADDVSSDLVWKRVVSVQGSNYLVQQITHGFDGRSGNLRDLSVKSAFQHFKNIEHMSRERSSSAASVAPVVWCVQHCVDYKAQASAMGIYFPARFLKLIKRAGDVGYGPHKGKVVSFEGLLTPASDLVGRGAAPGAGAPTVQDFQCHAGGVCHGSDSKTASEGVGTGLPGYGPRVCNPRCRNRPEFLGWTEEPVEGAS